MTIKNPYEPPTYGVRHLAIERRIAEQAEPEAEEKPKKSPAKKKGKK